MIKRSVSMGLWLGLALILVTTYPLISLGIAPQVFRVTWPNLPELLGSLLLLINGAVGIIVLGLVGSLAAMRSDVHNTGQGFLAGAICGLVAASILYVFLLAPTQALIASARLWQHQPTLNAPHPPGPALAAFIREMTIRAHVTMALVLLGGGLLGGLEGALVGALRRHPATPQLGLLDVIGDPQPRRRWFRKHDDVWRAGIVSGLAVGGIVWLSLMSAFLTGLQSDWPQLGTLVSQNTGPLVQALFSESLFGCLLPVFILALVGTGALAVLLLKDPPRRQLSRFQVVVVAGIAASVPVFQAVTNIAFFGLGFSRHLMWDLVRRAQEGTLPSGWTLDAQTIEFLRTFAQTPLRSLSLFYILPIVLFVVVLILIQIWLVPQAVLYGLTLPLIFRRPVDRAARIVHTVQKQSTSLLPQIYKLFGKDAQAQHVLPHLAFYLKDPQQQQVVAAYHALSGNAAQAERAVSIIRSIVAEHQDWSWRTEICELFRILEQGLAARTLTQVTAIQPPPQEITSSLPLLLSKSCEGIGRILDELKKVERVDDLGTKMIFMNSAQAALLDLHRFVEQESKECTTCATLYAEVGILHAVLDRWQGLALMATQELQGRADLQAKLLASRTNYGPRVRQSVLLTNQGLNVAQNIQVQVSDGKGYKVLDGARQSIDILGPQESREIEFWLAPEAPQRLRIVWQITYDDTVDTGRAVKFADAMELFQEQPERPFHRIFPIPYVTGTPLRSGEMFVGRQDIFDFVQEHLLGTFQNNVIVLHGQRRTGKTSILYRLQDVLADTHVGVLVDMQGKAARGTADFLYALSDDIAYSLENHGIMVDLPQRQDFEDNPEFTFRSRFIRTMVRQLDSRNLLLMFDEFEELQRRVEDERLEPEIFAFLRNLMQHEPRLDFVFSGTHKLEELGAEYWSILFNIAAYKRITFLDPSEVQRLVQGPVRDYGLEYDPLAIERIIQVTAGHPYFAQVVCHEMVAFHNEVERNYLTVTCVDQVLERIIERGEAHFKYIWAGAPKEEQMVLLALADLLPDPDAGATPLQVSEELQRKGFVMSFEEQAQALAALVSKDIVARSGPQSSLFRFKIDLIRRWISITRPAM